MKNFYENISDAVCGGDALSLFRLCGAAEDELYSDFDRLRYLLKILPLCSGHPVYDKTVYIFRRVFGIDILSRLNDAEKIWTACSLFIEKNGISEDDIRDLPSGVSAKAAENPTGKVYSPQRVLYLNDIKSCGHVDFDALLTSASDAAASCDAAEFDACGYAFKRNSRKNEIRRIFAGYLHGENDGGRLNELLTAYLVHVCHILTENGKRLVLRADGADCPEIFKLFSYLKLNGYVPRTLLVTGEPEKLADLVSEFTFSGDVPGIVISSSSPVLPSVFPIGLSEIYLPERVFPLGEENT